MDLVMSYSYVSVKLTASLLMSSGLAKYRRTPLSDCSN